MVQWDFQAHLGLLNPGEEFSAWWEFQALFKERVTIVSQEVGLAISSAEEAAPKLGLQALIKYFSDEKDMLRYSLSVPLQQSLSDLLQKHHTGRSFFKEHSLVTSEAEIKTHFFL